MKINGIKEIMIFTKDLEKSFLINLTSQQLIELINTSLSEESTLTYVYNEYEFDNNSELNIKVNYQEADTTPPVPEGMVRLVFWQELDEGNVSADLIGLQGDVTLNLKGNTYGCMDDWEYQTFDSLFTNTGTELFLESESYGNEKIYVYFLNSKKECAYSIADINSNDNLDEEFEEMKLDYCN
jgi:hypothetical protein